MITISQCRAARGLLDWTQQDLADASGLSKTAINNFEKGHSDIKNESLRAIRMAFESADIEFLKEEGLRKKSEKAQIFKGEQAFSELLDDIFETMKASGGEVQIINPNETTSGQTSQKKMLEQRERMKQHNITERVLCARGNTNASKYFESRRYLDDEVLSFLMTTFLYGKKVAFELWDQSVIVVLDSAEAHQAEYLRFEQMWVRSKNVDQEAAQARQKSG